MNWRSFAGFAALATLLAGVNVRPAAAEWTPAAWQDVGTLEILTVGPEEGEHWSTLWLVVINDQVYLRLGNKAAERVEKNTMAPNVKVRIGGQEFEQVRAVPSPDAAQQVADAMADKYFSDLLIRFFPHPLTVRLELDDTAGAP